jgi:hypothetical protein
MGGLALAAAIAGVAEPHRPRVVLACRPAGAYARPGAEALDASCIRSPDVAERQRVLARLSGGKAGAQRRRRGVRA